MHVARPKESAKEMGDENQVSKVPSLAGVLYLLAWGLYVPTPTDSSFWSQTPGTYGL